METATREQKAAVFLYILGGDAAELVLSRLPGEMAVTMRERLQKLSQTPPATDEIDEILDAFEQLMGRVPKSSPTGLRLHHAEEADSGAVPDEPAEKPAAPKPLRPAVPRRVFEPSDDAIADLRRLDPSQIAGALAKENARTIAIVLQTMPPESAANVLRQLPTSVQASALLTMGNCNPPARWLLERLVRTTVTNAAAIEPTTDEPDNREHRMAETLRALPRGLRTGLMEQIADNDPDLADRLRAMLYVFDDLQRIENRSLQRLLTEIESETLLIALHGADEAIVDKVYANISKRVRAHLMEEMQLMGVVRDERVEEARAAIGKAICELDRQGALVMIE